MLSFNMYLGLGYLQIAYHKLDGNIVKNKNNFIRGIKDSGRGFLDPPHHPTPRSHPYPLPPTPKPHCLALANRRLLSC